MMPRLDGCQTCAPSTRSHSFKDIPAIKLPSTDGLSGRARGRMAGCGGCLTKPVTEAELLAKIETALKS